MVLMSHMHFDHATGLTDVDGNSIFSNATHFVQQDEWHEFTSLTSVVRQLIGKSIEVLMKIN